VFQTHFDCGRTSIAGQPEELQD